MTGGLEAAGDIATGGLIAGAVEQAGRPHGRAATAHAHDPQACLDCGTPLVGSHCHACGQAAHVHSTMGGFAHEVLHGVFHFEGKIWRTLPMLALHPGQLTRRYVDGERTKFVTPMALFLFSVFLMFAVVAQLPAFRGVGEGAQRASSGFAEARRDVAKSAASLRARIAELERQRTLLVQAGGNPAAIDTLLGDARSELTGLKVAEAALPGKAEASPKLRAEAQGEGKPSSQETENWFERKIAHARENPKLFLYKMKSAGYKYSWALIPISLPFIWMMFFWKRRFGMYDHAIFATYSLSFMSLLVVVLSLPIAYGSKGVADCAWIAMLIIPPIHMYWQLKHGYLLSRFGAAWRTFVLLNIVTVTSGLFFAWLLYMGVSD